MDLNKKTLNSVVGISRSDASKKIVYCHDFTKGQQLRRFSALSLPQIEHCDADTPGDLSAQFLASPSLAHTRHEKEKELK